jgi:hypothetical protein
MTTAKRNNAIKKLLEQYYGKGKVWVRGSRGTAHGWVHVYIDYAGDGTHNGREERSQVMALIHAANIEIDTYGYDDPGSDYGYGSKIHVNFYKPYDVRQKEEHQLAHAATSI